MASLFVSSSSLYHHMYPSQATVPRAARLFDQLFADTQPKRQPLRGLCPNSSSKRRIPSRRVNNSSTTCTADNSSPDDEQSPGLFSDPVRKAKTRRKKQTVVRFNESEVKQKGKGDTNRRKKYTQCTKDAVLEAFEKANLPNYEEIAQHELNITFERPGSRRQRGEPVKTPPINELLQVFEETDLTARSRTQTLLQHLDPSPLPVGSERREEHISLSQPPELVALNLLEPINIPNQRYRRRHCATLIHPIRLSNSSPRRVTRSSSQVSSRMSSPLVQPEDGPNQESTNSSNKTVQQRTSTMIQNTISDNLFAVPAIPVSPLAAAGRKTYVEPNTLREDAFGQSFGAGMTSTPLNVAQGKTRPFLKPNTRPLFHSMNVSTVGLSTGRSVRPSHSITRSRLQSAGQLQRTICCRKSNLNETVVSHRDELRQTLISSFATAFSTAILIDEKGEEQILSYRDKVLALCSPQEVTTFQTVFTTDVLQSIRKIGEGSYGEIYMSKDPEGVELVWKLVPFNLDGKEEDDFRQILPEVMICSSFNRLRESSINRSMNFIHMDRAACIRGKFPDKLLQEWDEYDKKKQSENMDPREYPADHLHLLMVLNNGGVDLEHCKLKSASEALGIFLQTAFSLAAAESEFEFEHRDLHWGNVLVMPVAEEVAEYTVAGISYEVPSGNMHVSTIDFTLSRISQDECIIYDDLAKYDDLFEGDAKVDYQFEVYRKMKSANGNNWEKFCPKSNILWLDYLLDKLLNFKKYTSRSKTHQKAVESLRKFRKNILGFYSCKDFIESSFMNGILSSL